MSLAGKLVSEFEINVEAEACYKMFRNQISHIPNISPNIIQKVEVQGGDWGSYGHGSIKIWNYTIEGKAEVFKERVEYDDQKLTTTLIGLEGDVFKQYKTWKVIFQVVPKGPKQSLAVMTLEYEKLVDGSPYPYKYLDIMNNLIKGIESYLK